MANVLLTNTDFVDSTVKINFLEHTLKLVGNLMGQDVTAKHNFLLVLQTLT